MGILDKKEDQHQQSFESELKVSDKLAYERTILAQERTLMAVIRTSVSLISFGFTIAKFFQDLKASKLLTDTSVAGSSNVGLWLVLIGTAYIIACTTQHKLILRQLYVSGVKKRVSFTFILAIVISLLGTALVISFYTNILSLGLNRF